jgi:hypothetical protein
VVRAAVEALCRTWLENASLLRPIVHRAGRDPEVFRRGSQASRDEARRFRAVLVSVGASESDADAVFRLTYAALVQRVMYGEAFESDVPLDDGALVELLTQAAQRQLGLGLA